jgi:hypothetical protein
MKTIHGQPSWHIASDRVDAHVSQLGGQIAPVIFDRKGRKIAPYSIAPWAEEKVAKETPAMIRALRGDFFCLPFGGNDTRYRGESHPPHGETANAKWRFESLASADGKTTLHLSLATKIRPGRVDKEITLADGQDVIYSRHTISRMSGPMCLGHHAMLKFPDYEGSGRISAGAFHHGQVFPAIFEHPRLGGYNSLKQGAQFTSLESVPMSNGASADLTRYPARRGFEDLVMLLGDAGLPFGWTAVTFIKERFVWFALKDPKILRETVLWHSNRGRHYAPWSSRHVGVLGIEDVTANFHFGLAESAAPNPISAQNWPTHVKLDPKKPLAVNYIMGVAPIPAGFDRVAKIEAAPDQQSITLEAESARKTTAKVDLAFLG